MFEKGVPIYRWALLVLLSVAVLGSQTAAQNQVMGEVAFEGPTKIEKTSGVWIDNQYVGFLKELNGDKKIMLLPGQHDISVRQAGFQNFEQRITVEPGQKQIVSVTMRRSNSDTYSKSISTLKLKVEPDRAAVFVDDRFVGHAKEFGGAFRSMQLSPGKHRIKIDLPGYRTFETEVNLLPGQKSEIKTELLKGSIDQASPLIKKPE